MTPANTTLLVAPGPTGRQVDLRVTGGTVTWSASVSNDPGHLVTVTPASGTLTPASPGTVVTIRISRFADCGAGNGQDNGGSTRTACPTITFSPGGATIWLRTGYTFPYAGMAAPALFVPPPPAEGHGAGHSGAGQHPVDRSWPRNRNPVERNRNPVEAGAL